MFAHKRWRRHPIAMCIRPFLDLAALKGRRGPLEFRLAWSEKRHRQLKKWERARYTEAHHLRNKGTTLRF